MTVLKFMKILEALVKAGADIESEIEVVTPSDDHYSLYGVRTYNNGSIVLDVCDFEE